MQYRQLGRTGLEISIVGLGCSSLGGGVFLRNDGQALRLLHGAHERGVTFYDTADSYGYGHSESLLGRAFKGRRQRRRVLEAAARAHGRPINHLALQFVLQHAAVSTVIPGTRSVEHLEDNCRALQASPLAPEEMARITAAAPPDRAVAPRRKP